MQHVLSFRASRTNRRPATVLKRGRKLLQQLAMRLEIYRQRRALLSMSDAMLRDIGISRADAEGEAMRSFWDVPTDWR